MDTEAVSRPHPIAPSRRLPPRRFQRNSNTPLVIGEESLCRTRPYYFRRCKRVCPTNIHCLPNELLSDILVRLPADYLQDRARLVCSRWYHIICSDAFVNKQFHHSTYGLLLSYRSQHPCHPIFMTATQAQAGRVETYELSYKYINRLVNSCNGFVIELDKNDANRYTDLLFIVNPATKQSLVLPPLQPRQIPANYFCCMSFAASSMKYKVVLAYSERMEERQLAILTIGVDNSWRNVKTDHLPIIAKRLLTTPTVISEGFIHWAYYGISHMITMDVETEILTWRSFYDPLDYIEAYHLSTGRFLSRLVAFRELLWEIWGMNSETGEWRKVLPDINLGGLLHEFAAAGKNEALRALLHEFASKREKEVLVPLGWVNYPEVLAFRLSCGSSRTCILYNRETHEINTIELPQPCAHYKCRVHRNSLTRLS